MVSGSTSQNRRSTSSGKRSRVTKLILAGRAKSRAVPEFIFTMRAVTKVHPPDKKVLDNVHLAFYPGAKIGVIGANGSGKSSLMRIMAGIDTTHGGDAKP